MFIFFECVILVLVMVMFKTDIEYSRNTLYINVTGIVNKKNVGELKRKMYYIIDEYGISDIVIDIKGVINMDKDAFYQFLDDYDEVYGGNLNIVD